MVVYYVQSSNLFVTDYIMADCKPSQVDYSWWIVPGTLNLED